MQVSEVIDALGGNKAVAEMFGVGVSAVSNWRSWNKFPPRLHLRVLRECEARGLDFDPAPADQPQKVA